jgi:hypothetical protein
MLIFPGQKYDFIIRLSGDFLLSGGKDWPLLTAGAQHWGRQQSNTQNNRSIIYSETFLIQNCYYMIFVSNLLLHSEIQVQTYITTYSNVRKQASVAPDLQIFSWFYHQKYNQTLFTREKWLSRSISNNQEKYIQMTVTIFYNHWIAKTSENCLDFGEAICQ